MKFLSNSLPPKLQDLLGQLERYEVEPREFDAMLTGEEGENEPQEQQ